MAARQRVMASMRHHAAVAGFIEIGTPALEYAETLLGQGGGDTDKEVYRFKDHGERDVALRFDLTVPFARYVAENQGTMVFPFKRLQIGDVWRGENPQKGRYREFCQADLDIIGSESLSSDVEILTTLAGVLHDLDVGNFTITIGHRPILTALIQLLLPGSHEGGVLIAIDKLAKIGREKTLGLIAAAAPQCPPDACARLLDLISPAGAEGETNLDAVISVFGANAGAVSTHVSRLRETLQLARELISSSRIRLRVDLTLARGLGYYTGIVFEMTHDELRGFGSIGGGGRYDGLVSRFSTRSLGGVGGSIGIDRLTAGLEELSRLWQAPAVQVFVVLATPDVRSYGLQLASRLRRAGFATDVALNDGVGKIASQFRHADRLGARLVVTVGTSELAAMTYALREMASGDERRDLPAAGLEKEIARLL